jgi:hypothetical protein
MDSTICLYILNSLKSTFWDGSSKHTYRGWGFLPTYLLEYNMIGQYTYILTNNPQELAPYRFEFKWDRQRIRNFLLWTRISRMNDQHISQQCHATAPLRNTFTFKLFNNPEIWKRRARELVQKILVVQLGFELWTLQKWTSVWYLDDHWNSLNNFVKNHETKQKFTLKSLWN